jgi:hypothetical protein
MAIDIKALIRGRREARAGGIEELASRLASGEAVAPEEIEAHLERTGCDEDLLQERIDAIVRRAELLAAVSRGNGAQAKIDKLVSEIDKAWEAVADAQRKHAAVRDRHADELLTLRQAVDAANRASDTLLDPANLHPVDRDRLANARKAASDAVSAYGELRRRMPDLRLSVQEGERLLADAVDHAKLNRSNADVQAHKARSENTANARKARLAEAEAELPKLKAAAEQAEAAVAAIEDELRR